MDAHMLEAAGVSCAALLGARPSPDSEATRMIPEARSEAMHGVPILDAALKRE